MGLRRTRRAPGIAVALAALLAAACTASGNEGGGPTTTRPEAITCPDGRPLVPADPAPSPPPPAPPSPGEPGRVGALDVGTLLPHSGDLAFLGAAPAAGVELAVADLDAQGGVLGAPLTLHRGDSADGTDGAAEAEVERLLAAGVDVIVGPMAAGVGARVIEQVAAGGALLLTPGATSAGLEELDRAGRVFRLVPTDPLQGRALAELVLDDGPRAASLVVRDDDYGRAIADAFTARFEAGRGVVRSRTDYDPVSEDVGELVPDRVVAGHEAVVLVGLAESALALDVLAAAGAGPRERPVYGTDGNLGDRLADLVDDPSDLACMRGVLPVADTPEDLADRLRREHPALAAFGAAALEHAAEAYDAVVIAALAATAAGTDDAEAMAAAMAEVTNGGTTCRDVGACLALAADGADLAYVGASGRTALGPAGNRREARVTVVTFDDDGHLARVGSRRVGPDAGA